MPEEERKLTGSGFYDVEKFAYDYDMYSDDFEEVRIVYIIDDIYSMKATITMIHKASIPFKKYRKR